MTQLKISGAVEDLMTAIVTMRKVYGISCPIGTDMQDDIGRAIVADNFGDIEAKRAQILFTTKQRVNITHMPTSPLYILYHDWPSVQLIYRGPLKPVWDMGFELTTSTNKRVVRLWKLAELPQ